MITRESLAAAGYRQYMDGSIRLRGEACQRLWQKRVTDGRGIRYYVNVFEYDLKKTVPAYKGTSPCFEAEAQFRGKDDVVVNVQVLPAAGQGVEDVEAVIGQIWESMGFQYADPGWQDEVPEVA